MSGHPGGPGPDKTANEVQCKTDKGDIKDTDPHDVDRRMKPFCRRGSADGYDLTSPCKSARLLYVGPGSIVLIKYTPGKIKVSKQYGRRVVPATLMTLWRGVVVAVLGHCACTSPL